MEETKMSYYTFRWSFENFLFRTDISGILPSAEDEHWIEWYQMFTNGQSFHEIYQFIREYMDFDAVKEA